MREIEVLKIIAEGLSNKEIAISTRHQHQDRRETSPTGHEQAQHHEVAGLTRYALSQRLVEKKVPVGV